MTVLTIEEVDHDGRYRRYVDGMVLVWILTVVILVFGIAALIKFLRS
jgi:hypothetical protein